MKKFTLSLLVLYGILLHISSQTPDTTKNFRYGGFGALTFNQVHITNWTAGGEDALSATGVVNLFGNYKKDKVAWDNTLDMAYGFIQSGTGKSRKNEDKIELNSKFGYKAFGKVFYSALVNFRSQSIMANLIYDQNVIAKTQFKESIGVGLSYKF